MRGRNTVGEHYKFNRTGANSVERKTVTANHQAQMQSHNRHPSNHSNQQMAKTITETLIKVPNQMKRSSISTSLKPNQKTLFSTISSFLYSIDHQFDQSSLDFDMIIQILNFFGYPHNYSKTVFQPVGAPHTWHSCLQMMQFLADIANYYFEYKMHVSEMEGEQDYNDLIYESFQKQDDQMIERYHKREHEKLKKEEQQLIFRIESSQLTFKNIKNSQKSLAELTEQESNLLQKLDRETQNVIEIDQTNTKIINEIQKTEDQLEEISMERSRLVSKMNMLEQEINNQQLNVDEANRIEAQIKEYHAKIHHLKEDHEKQKQKYEEQKKQLIEVYFNFQAELSEVSNNITKFQREMGSRNIDICKPQPNTQLFMEIMAEEDFNAAKQKLDRCIETDKINKMLNQQHNFYAILEMQKKHMAVEEEQQSKNKHSIDLELNSLKLELEQLYSVDRENSHQYELISKETLEIQDQQNALFSEQEKARNTLDEYISKQKSLNDEIHTRKEQLRLSLPKVKKYQQETQRILSQIENQIAQTKNQLELRLQKIYQQFKQLGIQVSQGLQSSQ